MGKFGQILRSSWQISSSSSSSRISRIDVPIREMEAIPLDRSLCIYVCWKSEGEMDTMTDINVFLLLISHYQVLISGYDCMAVFFLPPHVICINVICISNCWISARPCFHQDRMICMKLIPSQTIRNIRRLNKMLLDITIPRIWSLITFALFRYYYSLNRHVAQMISCLMVVNMAINISYHIEKVRST